MQRAMARQAEAERERRAKVIHAEGEYQASERLRDAADILRPNPAALQLRYLQTLTEVGNNDSSTIVFALPLDVMGPLLEHAAAAPAATRRSPSDADDGDPRRLEQQHRSDALPTVGGRTAMRAWQRFRRISPAPADDTYAATGSGASYQASAGQSTPSHARRG